jgi:arylsulfatase A-like enzyme
MKSSRRKPNILLITTDTQRYDALACYGNPHALSPHLDRNRHRNQNYFL